MPNATQPKPRQAGSYAGKSAVRRQQERYETLLAAGVRLMGSEGFAAASIDKICLEAGLAKRYFYESFKTREDLLIAAYRAANMGLLQRIERDARPHQGQPREMIRATLHAVFDYLADDAARARVLMLESVSVRTQISREFGHRSAVYLQLVLDFTRPYLPDAEPPELEVMALAAIGSINYLAQRWIALNFVQPKEELVAGAIRVFDGIGRELGIPVWLEA